MTQHSVAFVRSAALYKADVIQVFVSAPDVVVVVGWGVGVVC